jgi:hypothetical protein
VTELRGRRHHGLMIPPGPRSGRAAGRDFGRFSCAAGTCIAAFRDSGRRGK